MGIKQRLKDFHKYHPTVSSKVKRIAQKLTGYNHWDRFWRLNQALKDVTWDRFRRTDKQIERWTWERFQRTDKQIEKWTWERFQRTEKRFDQLEATIQKVNEMLLDQSMNSNLVKYRPQEAIRIVFLFQIPSCWPSLESVWNCITKDRRFEAKMLLYDRQQKEAAQMAHARETLEELGIPYVEAEYYDFAAERPHIIVYQTPWDEQHRPEFLWTDRMKRLGIRVAYLPYGIEYSESVKLSFIFSIVQLKTKPWRSYVLSEQMKLEHRMKSPYGDEFLRVTGLPKFDSLYDKRKWKLEKEIWKSCKNRKIVFWQMHFPAMNGCKDYPEPLILVYLEFARALNEYEDLFFLVRPHPKFFETYLKKGFRSEVDEMKEIFASTENVYLYDAPDYRIPMVNANYIIGDRSALMIEAIVLGVPVLYMTNFYFKEKMLEAVLPIFESYYQGSTAYDMRRFIDLIIRKNCDYKKNERLEAMKQCIPYFDGNCGKRIVDDMAEAIYGEADREVVV